MTDPKPPMELQDQVVVTKSPTPGRPSSSQVAVQHYRAAPSRIIEDAFFAIGALLASLRALGELAIWYQREVGHITAPHQDHGFPWGFAALCVLCLAPKMLGRATAGKVWSAIGDGVSRRIGGKAKDES